LIVAEHKGRLGNQLFQLAGALRLAKPGERVLLLGYEDLERFLEPDRQIRYLNSNHPLIYRLATRAMAWSYRLPNWLRRQLWSSLQEDMSIGRIEKVGARRTLFRLTMVKETYFLGDEWLAFELFDRRRIRRCWREQAGQWFADRGLDPQSCCFVHVRRGDYCHYPSTAEPGVLPRQFFVEMMERMAALQDASAFVVASDDWPWVRDALPELPASQLVLEDVELTLAVLASCGSGILSPSTFGWAAALFAGSAEQPQRFLAPQHWVGFRRGEWYPYPGVESCTLSYGEWSPDSTESLVKEIG
jgi:hypothetical protein